MLIPYLENRFLKAKKYNLTHKKYLLVDFSKFINIFGTNSAFVANKEKQFIQNTLALLLLLFVSSFSGKASASFTTPTPVYPAGGNLNFGTDITYQWRANTGAIGYELFVYDRTIPGIIFRDTNISTSVCNSAGLCRFNPSGADLPEGKLHVWRVRAKYPGGNSTFSYIAFNIVVPKVTISDLGYTPNPAKVGEKQHFSFKYANATKCYALNSAGNEITYYQGDLKSGSYSWTSPIRTEPKEYRFSVTCLGLNNTFQTEPVSYSVHPVANKKPVVTAHLPQSNKVYSELETVSLRVNATDYDGEVIKVEFNLDSQGWQELPRSNIKYEKRLTSQLSVGSHKIKFRAKDNSDEYSSVVSRSFIIKKPPEIISLNINDNDVFSSLKNIIAKVNAKAYGGEVSLVKYSINAGEWLSTTSVSNVDLGKLAVGEHTIIFIVNDSDNIVSSKISRTISVPPLPVIKNLGYSPNPAVIGQTQDFSFNYEHAVKCYALNEFGKEIIYYQGPAKEGRFTWTSPNRDEIKLYEFKVICINEAGDEKIEPVYYKVIPKVTLANLGYSPNPAVIGQTQDFSFNYEHAVKCYALNEFDKEIIYYQGIENSGKYTWTSPVRDKIKKYDFAVTCIGKAGDSVTVPVGYEVTLPKVTIKNIHLLSAPLLKNNGGSE
jgi:hypothetical protein